MIKRILLAIAIVVIGLVLLNFGYFKKQFDFLLGRVPQQTTVYETSSTESTTEPNTIVIPSLDIRAPIQYVNEKNEDVFQRALQDGVVHYPGTADIGQPGNAYLFGHSSDYPFAPGKYKTVFALLPRIADGAIVEVTDKNGTLYRYKVFNQFVAENTDTHLLDQKEYKEKLLTLQTSYPIGTALQRYIVVARLIE